MIIVRVELHSAITHEVTELARMKIWNDGTSRSEEIGNYLAETYRWRDRAALDRAVMQRHAAVVNFPKKARHVWNLVALLLMEMRYG